MTRTLAQRQASHAQAVEFLREAYENLDDAVSCLADAGLQRCIHIKVGGRRIDIEDVLAALDGALRLANESKPEADDDGDAAYDQHAENLVGVGR